MSLKKNFIYNTVYQIFMIILPLITVPYVSRVLGPEGLGKYSYTGAYSQYFVLLGMIGISLYGNRQVAYVKKDKEKLSREFWNIYGLQFITTIVSLILYYIIFVVINNVDRNLYIIQSLPIIAAVFDISWFFIGYEDMKSVVVRNSITKIIGIVLIFIFVKNSNDVSLYAAIMGGTIVIGQLIMWLNIKNKVDFVRPTIKYAIIHLRPSLALFISQLAIQVYTLLDRTMLGIFTSEAQVGLYDNSQKMIKLLVTLACSLGVVMLPRMSALYSEGKMDEFKEMIYKAFSFVNFISFPMVFGLIAIAGGFSEWFYGSEFSGIEILLRIGSLIIIAISWSNILGIQIMLPMKKEKEFTMSVTLGAVMNLVLNFILIFNLKSLGTTIASVVAEFSVTLIQLYFLREVVDIKRLVKGLGKPILSSIIMYLVVVLTTKSLSVGIISTMIQVFIGGCSYFVVMVLLKEKILIDSLNLVGMKVSSRRKN